MRLKKQSMREVADAGMVTRSEQRDPRLAYREDELAQATARKIDDKPRYFRGALIKSKPETKTNGDES